jgi:hypothetical protein
MKLSYTYETEGKFLIGYLDEYPQHPTEAFSVEELEDNLRDIYRMVKDGTLDGVKHGVLEVAV